MQKRGTLVAAVLAFGMTATAGCSGSTAEAQGSQTGGGTVTSTGAGGSTPGQGDGATGTVAHTAAEVTNTATTKPTAAPVKPSGPAKNTAASKPTTPKMPTATAPLKDPVEEAKATLKRYFVVRAEILQDPENATQEQFDAIVTDKAAGKLMLTWQRAISRKQHLVGVRKIAWMSAIKTEKHRVTIKVCEDMAPVKLFEKGKPYRKIDRFWLGIYNVEYTARKGRWLVQEIVYRKAKPCSR